MMQMLTPIMKFKPYLWQGEILPYQVPVAIP